MGIKITNLTKTYQQVLCAGVIGDFSNDEDNDLDQIIVDDFEKIFNRLDKKLPVHFYLHSFGGSLIDARQMMNIMENYKNNGGVIKVIVPYVAASCATLLALSGNELIYDEDGLFLIHSVYYDPSSFSEKYKLDEKTLNSLQQDIKEQNDFLADFYSKKSTKSSEDYRVLLSDAKDIILKPNEMKNDYGFDLDIINSVLESEKYSVNKFSKNLNDDELHKIIKNATTLGFIKDFKLKNFVEDTTVENKLLGDDKKLPNELKDTTTQNLTTNTGKLEKMALSGNNSNETPDSSTPEANGNNNTSKTPNGVKVEASLTSEQLEQIKEEARLKAQAEISDKNKKVYDLFSKYLNDADYLKEYQNCLNGMYTYDECKQRFLNLKTSKDKKTFRPTVGQELALNFANVDDVVYALCLKDGIDTKAENEVKRKLNYSKMTKEQIKLRDMPLSQILVNHINAKKLQECKPTLELDPFNSSYDNAVKILNEISQADLTNILTLFSTEIWDQSNSYYNFETILSMLKWQKVIDENKVTVIKNNTPVKRAEIVPENGEPVSLNISVKSQDFRASKMGIKMGATFETLLNDRFEMFKESFTFLLQGIKKGFHYEFVKTLLENREKNEKVTDVSSVKEALTKVEDAFFEMRDESGDRILLQPKYLYSTPPVVRAFKSFLTSKTDPTQLNSNKDNEWLDWAEKTGIVYISDGHLDEVIKKEQPELFTTNKNDAYFIPEGAIRYLSVTPDLTPRIMSESGKFGLKQEVAGFVLFGIAYVDPESVVCVDTNKILENASKVTPIPVTVQDKAN